MLLSETNDTRLNTIPLNKADDLFAAEGLIAPNLEYWFQCLQMITNNEIEISGFHRMIAERIPALAGESLKKEISFDRFLSMANSLEKTGETDVRWIPGWKNIFCGGESEISEWNRYVFISLLFYCVGV